MTKTKRTDEIVREIIELLEAARDVMNMLEERLAPRNIVIECEGGIVHDVHGMPEGYTYEIVDFDELEDAGAQREAVEEKLKATIAAARAQ